MSPTSHAFDYISDKSTNLSLAQGSEEINPGKPKLGEPPSIIMNKSLIPSKSKAHSYMQKAGDCGDISPQFFLDFPKF